MKIIFSIIIFFQVISVSAQKITHNKANEKKLLTEATNFRIDSFVYYVNPFITDYYVPIEKEFTPPWLPAHLIKNRPDLYDNYNDLLREYSHIGVSRDTIINHKIRRSLTEYLDHEKKLYPEKPLFGYTIGEIWFTDIKTNVQIISLSHRYAHSEKPLQINFSNDSLKNTSMICQLYYFENDTLKIISSSLYDSLELDKYSFWKTTDFIKIMSEVPFYTRSIVKNGHRIFETVKNTPNGPVVVGNQAWYLRYWWAIAAGLIIIVLLVFLIRRKSKK